MQILHGNNIDLLKTLPDNSVDSIVTDPPYGLSFMNKKWDYDVPSVELWQEVYRVLKHGGHVLSFGGTRTYHRMVVNIEDAGFEIRDQIMWLYGSGFPKSLNIGKAIDKRGGNNHLTQEIGEKLKSARESRKITKNQADEMFCNGTTNYMWFEGRTDGIRLPDDESFTKICNQWEELKPYQDLIKSANREIIGQYDGDMGGLGGERLGQPNGDITIAATESAKIWEGWGTALKPANEPICLARKPLSEKSIAENVLKHGTGGINIDGCRVNFQNEEDRKESTAKNQHADFGTKPMTNNNVYGDYSMIEPKNYDPQGRFPANVIHDGSDEVMECFPETKSVTRQPTGNYILNPQTGWNDNSMVDKTERGYNDSGNASRFFYCAKASKSDRNDGCEKLQGKYVAKGNQAQAELKRGNVDFENGHYYNKVELKQNFHPTVKPTELMRYLCRLITPPNGIVLDPFMGSGSTGKGAILEGFDFIGMELDPEYVEIAKARIEYAQKEFKENKSQQKLF